MKNSIYALFALTLSLFASGSALAASFSCPLASQSGQAATLEITQDGNFRFLGELYFVNNRHSLPGSILARAHNGSLLAVTTQIFINDRHNGRDADVQLTTGDRKVILFNRSTPCRLNQRKPPRGTLEA
jgi:hypothetical protein